MYIFNHNKDMYFEKSNVMVNDYRALKNQTLHKWYSVRQFIAVPSTLAWPPNTKP